MSDPLFTVMILLVTPVHGTQHKLLFAQKLYCEINAATSVHAGAHNKVCSSYHLWTHASHACEITKAKQEDLTTAFNIPGCQDAQEVHIATKPAACMEVTIAVPESAGNQEGNQSIISSSVMGTFKQCMSITLGLVAPPLTQVFIQDVTELNGTNPVAGPSEARVLVTKFDQDLLDFPALLSKPQSYSDVCLSRQCPSKSWRQQDES